MESTLGLSAIIICIGLAVGWFIGSDSWHPIERNLSKAARKLSKIKAHQMLIFLGCFMFAFPSFFALVTNEIPAEAIYSAFKLPSITGAGMVGVGIAIWVAQKRRSRQDGRTRT